MRKKSVKRGQIFPPYKVPYEYAMCQEDFDVEYICKEYCTPVTPAYSNALPKQREKQFCFDSRMKFDITTDPISDEEYDISTVEFKKEPAHQRYQKEDVSIANLAEECWYNKRWGFSESPLVRKKKLGSDRTKVIEYLR